MTTKKIVKNVLSNLFGACIYRKKIVLGYFIKGNMTTVDISKKKYVKAVNKFGKDKPLLTNILLKQGVLLKTELP